MHLQDYATLLTDALARNETIVLACTCSIRYSGRAESYLAAGDRVILIKGDKAILVHQPTGNAPINYMKPQTGHSVIFDNGKLSLKSSNLAMKEFLDVVIERVHFYNSQKLEDSQTIVVAGTEEDMSNMLYDNPGMIEEGFKPVSREEQTKYGFIDVFGTDKDGTLTIVECKRYCADLSAVTQLRRYVEKMMVTKGVTNIRGILAAPKITENAKRMLEDWGFNFKVVRPPKYLEEFDKKQAKLDFF
jgi:RecB family endonuclease NucS